MGRGPTTLRAAVAAVALLLGAVAVDGSTAGAQPPSVDPAKVRWSRHRPDTILSVHTTKPVVALSFDDGPDPRWTPAVLNALAAHGARATFFDEGDHAEQWPDLVRRTVAEGHEVANHTYSHPDLPTLDGAELTRQVRRAVEAFRSTGTEPVPLFRPPKGLYDTEAARAVRAEGHLTVGWDVCLERFLGRHPHDDAEAVRQTLVRVHPGAIVLAHDGGLPDRSRTVRVLPALLDGLRAMGYEVVRITDLLAEAR